MLVLAVSGQLIMSAVIVAAVVLLIGRLREEASVPVEEETEER